MNDSTLIADLVRAGVAAELIARVSNALVEVASTGSRVDNVVDKRRAWDREYRRRKRENPPDIHPKPPDTENALLKKEDSKKIRKRTGEHIPLDWQPSEVDSEFARSRGMQADRLKTETDKFRNYWTAKSGPLALKLDWSATWRNWVLSWLDRNPNAAPTAPPNKQPAYLTPPPGAPSLEECLRPYRNAKAAGTQVRDHAGVGANGADRTAELPLSGGTALPPAGEQARGHPPDDFP